MLFIYLFVFNNIVLKSLYILCFLIWVHNLFIFSFNFLCFTVFNSKNNFFLVFQFILFNIGSLYGMYMILMCFTLRMHSFLYCTRLISYYTVIGTVILFSLILLSSSNLLYFLFMFVYSFIIVSLYFILFPIVSDLCVEYNSLLSVWY